ncbi:MAG: hypothetical protein OXB84_06690, partial [Halobacteriovoraceae bacterium]|nr:hypothetical protein [Halobacteriovoraceae bacterium]
MRIFLFFQQTILVIRAFAYGLFNWPLPFFSLRMRKRKEFERLNLTDPHSKPFEKSAAVAFHVASEGELEQVRPLIDRFIEKNKRVELIYTSESVEERCSNLALEHSELIRIFRLPLLCYFPWPDLAGQNLSDFISAKKIILCRYDFYPELLLRGARRDTCFILVSAALKRKKELKWPFNIYTKALYGLFDIIISSNDSEK